MKKDEKISKIKEAILKDEKVAKEHKEKALDKIEEWYIEDKAEGLLAEELLKITKEFLPVLEEIGLI